MDSPAPRSAVPAFVGQDAVSYSSFNFQFPRVIETIHKIISSNPIMQGQIGPQMPQIEEQVGPKSLALPYWPKSAP